MVYYFPGGCDISKRISEQSWRHSDGTKMTKAEGIFMAAYSAYFCKLAVELWRINVTYILRPGTGTCKASLLLSCHTEKHRLTITATTTGGIIAMTDRHTDRQQRAQITPESHNE